MSRFKVNSSWMKFYRWMNRHVTVKRIWQYCMRLAEQMWLVLQSVWLYLYPKNKYIRFINEYVRANLKKQESTLTFLKTLALNPRATGAVLPSSKYLARAMVSFAAFSDRHLIVELGAGTGAMTEAMLAAGIPPQNIIAIERAPQLVKKLQKRFPEVSVIEGDAAYLLDLLKDQTQPVSAVISSLPLRSLPQKTAQAVLAQIPQLLAAEGKYIQFTYDITSDSSYYPSHYQLLDSTIIWRNIPPAKIEVFAFNGEMH